MKWWWYVTLLLLAIGSVRVAAAVGRGEAEQIRGVRRLIDAGLEGLGRSLDTTALVNFGQFSLAFDVLQWALKDLWSSRTPDELAIRLDNLHVNLRTSRFFNDLILQVELDQFFGVLRGKYRAAWTNHFDEVHLARLGKAVNKVLDRLIHVPNKSVRSFLTGIVEDEGGFRSKVMTCNSFASLVSLLTLRLENQIGPIEKSEPLLMMRACLLLRRLIHVALPVPVDRPAQKYFLRLVKKVASGQVKPDRLMLTSLTRRFPILMQVDNRFLAGKAEQFFLSSPRLIKRVTFMAGHLLRALESGKASADIFAIGFVHVARSKFNFGSGDLAGQFLNRLSTVVCPVEPYHLTDSLERILDMMLHATSVSATQQTSPSTLGRMVRAVVRFLGFSDASGWNDSLQTQLVAALTSDCPLEEIREVFDLELYDDLADFIEPTGIDFPALIHQEYKQLGRLKSGGYKEQRKGLEALLTDLFSLGNRTIGALLSFIARRPDHLVEAKVLLRMAQFGALLEDSRLLASVLAEARPDLIGLEPPCIDLPSISSYSIEGSHGSQESDS